MIGATFCISCAERRLFSFSGNIADGDDEGQQDNGPAVVVNPVVVDISQADEQRLGDDAEPAKIHQGIQGRVHGLEHVQVLGGDEQAKFQRLGLRSPPGWQRGVWAFLLGPIGRGPLLPRQSEGDLIGSIGKEDSAKNLSSSPASCRGREIRAVFLHFALGDGGEVANRTVNPQAVALDGGGGKRLVAESARPRRPPRAGYFWPSKTLTCDLGHILRPKENCFFTCILPSL